MRAVVVDQFIHALKFNTVFSPIIDFTWSHNAGVLTNDQKISLFSLSISPWNTREFDAGRIRGLIYRRGELQEWEDLSSDRRLIEKRARLRLRFVDGGG